MIVTKADAKRLIREGCKYDGPVRISATRYSVISMPFPGPTLAFQALAKGSDSAVRVGILRDGGSWDWSWNGQAHDTTTA